MRAAKSGYNGHDFNCKWIVIYSQQIKNDKSYKKEKTHPRISNCQE